ncbi:MAG: hypothetical protein B1H12_02670 [Desulfobacteraceae bacterium 4484_190.2]|nr:MAG: hypothetical protein B1H12_02670 [Desulfobacteraceae bacterium 4484_190.2]
MEIVLAKIVLVWIFIGTIVAYIKLRQSRRFGFDRKVTVKTLPHVIVGVLLWPWLVFTIFEERKQHLAALRKLKPTVRHAVLRKLKGKQKR